MSPWPNGPEKGVTQKSRQTAENMRREIFSSELFFSKLKRGFIDLNIFQENCTENCLLSHCAFGLLMEQSNQNCIIALKKIRQNYNTVENMTQTILKPYQIFSLEYLKTIGIFKTIDHISRRIKRKIICFSRGSHFDSDLDNAFQTRIFEKTKTLSIYLMLENHENMLDKSHVSFINEVNIMSKEKLQYCKICEKNFSKSHYPYHRCYKLRCRKCPLLLKVSADEKFSLDGDQLCERNLVKDINCKCTKCEQIFLNSCCYKRHKVSNSFCKKFSECKKCNTIYQMSPHDCNKDVTFCRKCFKIHDISKTCKIEKSSLTRESKGFERILFLHLIFADSMPVISFLNDLNNLTPSHSLIVNAWDKNKIKSINIEEIKNKILLSSPRLLNFEESEGNFCFENIIGQILIYLQNQKKIKIICGKKTYNYLLENLAASDMKVNEKYGALNSFKFKNILFQSLQSFLDLNESVLAIMLKLNSCSVIMPTRVENIISLNENEKHVICQDDFDINNIYGTDPTQFITIQNDQNSFFQMFKEKSYYDRDLFFLISLCKHEIWTKALYEMGKLFSNVCNDLGEINPKPLWSFHSLTNAGFTLFRNQIDENVPVISSRPVQFQRNSSKQEIILSQLFILLHQEFCQNVPFTFISLNGKQFSSKNNLSSDIACSKCNFHYFIEGTFKVLDCKFHKIKEKTNFFHQNLKTLAMEAKQKRDLFQKDNPEIVLKVINGCCFNDYKNESIIEELSFFCKTKEQICKYLKIYEDLKLNFSKEEFLPLNCQDTIQPPLVEAFSQFSEISDLQDPCEPSFTPREPLVQLSESCTRGLQESPGAVPTLSHSLNPWEPLAAMQESPANSFNKPKVHKILRYDLNNAYANILQDENFSLPLGEPFKLMRNEAELFCEKHILKVPLKDVTFAAIKLLVTPNNRNIKSFIPFLGFRTNEKSYLTLCKSCVDNFTKTKQFIDCTHTDKERSFLTQCLSEDLWVAVNILGYSVKICEILYFEKREHFFGLEKISKILTCYKLCPKLDFNTNSIEVLRNNYKNNFISKKHFEFSHLSSFISKKILVSSIGRFALNCSKFMESKIFTNSLSLMSQIGLGKIHSFDFFGNDVDNKCLAFVPKNTTSFTYSKSARSNTNCLIFAHILNSVRRKIYFDCLSVHQSPNLNLERADCDSITFSIMNEKLGEKDCQNIFEKQEQNLSYKMELNDILGVYNLKRRSYILRRKKFNIFKTCGLKLTLKQRYVGDIKNMIYDTLKLNRKLKRLNNREGLRRIQTFPFGFKYYETEGPPLGAEGPQPPEGPIKRISFSSK